MSDKLEQVEALLKSEGLVYGREGQCLYFLMQVPPEFEGVLCDLAISINCAESIAPEQRGVQLMAFNFARVPLDAAEVLLAFLDVNVRMYPATRIGVDRRDGEVWVSHLAFLPQEEDSDWLPQQLLFLMSFSALVGKQIIVDCLQGGGARPTLVYLREFLEVRERLRQAVQDYEENDRVRKHLEELLRLS
jgi:hypothetical protein